MKEHQRRDAKLSNIIQRINKKEDVKDYLLVNGLLCKRTRARINPVKICVPQSLTNNVISYYHSFEYGGHPGYLKSLRKISARYTWDKMASEISEFVTSCEKCQLAKRKNEPKQGLLESKLDQIVNGHWYLDIIGRLTRSRSGYSYVIIVVDSCSKLVTLEPLRKLSSVAIIQVLRKIMCRRGFPHLISCDNASVFTSGAFKEFLFCHGIRCARISPYHAASNLSERYIAIWKSSVAIYCRGDQTLWDRSLLQIEFSINCAINSETKFAPFELVYKYNVNDPLDVFWEVDLVREVKNDPSILAEAFRNMKSSWEKRKKIYDRNRIQTRYQEEDLVLIKKHTKSSLKDKYCKSLDFKFEGPFKIHKLLTANSFLVQNVNNQNDFRKVHVDDCKKYRIQR
jgi:hypothetical protein